MVVSAVAALVPLALVSRYLVAVDPMPVGDIPGWRQVLAEDFDDDVPRGSLHTSDYAETLFPYRGYADTSGHGQYNPDQVLSVQDGALNWYLHSSNGVNNVSAVVVKIPETGWGQTYGRYSVRFRSDTLPRYKAAFILWPDGDNWGEGEINFPEVLDLGAGGKIYANMYRKGDVNRGEPGASTGFQTAMAAAQTGWHVATIEWLPSGVTFILDDVTLGTKPAGVPDAPLHWVLQVETSADGPAENSETAGHVEVDWVTAYAPA